MSELPTLGTAGQSPLAQPRGPLDQAIIAWLDAKYGRSGSTKTYVAYAGGIARFRAALQGSGLDLDGDPRAVALAAQGWAAERQPGSRGSGPVSPATYNLRLAILSSFYMYVRKRGFLSG